VAGSRCPAHGGTLFLPRQAGPLAAGAAPSAAVASNTPKRFIAVSSPVMSQKTVEDETPVWWKSFHKFRFTGRTVQRWSVILRETPMATDSRLTNKTVAPFFNPPNLSHRR
jgi:hypothetical protein